MCEQGRALRFKTPQPIPRPQFVRSEFLVFALGPTHNERIQCTQSPAKRRRPEPPIVANPAQKHGLRPSSYFDKFKIIATVQPPSTHSQPHRLGRLVAYRRSEANEQCSRSTH